MIYCGITNQNSTSLSNMMLMGLVGQEFRKSTARMTVPSSVMSAGPQWGGPRWLALEQLKLKESHPRWFHVTHSSGLWAARLKSVLPACGDSKWQSQGVQASYRMIRAPRTSVPAEVPAKLLWLSLDSHIISSIVPVKAVTWGWGWREEEVTLEIPPLDGRTGKEFAALFATTTVTGS